MSGDEQHTWSSVALGLRFGKPFGTVKGRVPADRVWV